MRPESTPEQRLVIIGDFVEQYVHHAKERGKERPLRILILDDFYISPIKDWVIDDLVINTVEECEDYILSRCGADALVRLVFSYTEWNSPSGMLVQVGTGLTMEHQCRALDFFGTRCSY